nr:cytochrome c oxidase subunit II [Chloroflexia bacterium]
MIRRNQDRAERGARTDAAGGRRRGAAGRVVILGTVAVVAAVLLSACGADERTPYSTVDPASPEADNIQALYKLIFWMALVVFVGVQFAIVYTAMRFRRPQSGNERPAQIHGNRRLEIIWTVIPAVVLLIILIPTITTLYDQDAAAQEGDIVVDVYGKQWWWEMQYGADAEGRDLGVVTANELRVPVGREVVIRLHSNNVIHSFWVPRLTGKTDLIPGHVNNLSFTPTEVGEYYGECAEFCGTQHAWMRFKVIVQPEEEFYNWVNAWRTGHPSTTNQDAPAEIAKAPQVLNLCLS